MINILHFLKVFQFFFILILLFRKIRDLTFHLRKLRFKLDVLLFPIRVFRFQILNFLFKISVFICKRVLLVNWQITSLKTLILILFIIIFLNEINCSIFLRLRNFFRFWDNIISLKSVVAWIWTHWSDTPLNFDIQSDVLFDMSFTFFLKFKSKISSDFSIRIFSNIVT